MVVLVLIVLAYIAVSMYKSKNPRNDSNNIKDNNVAAGSSMNENSYVKKCLETNAYTIECNVFFTKSQAQNFCKSVENNLKEKCFYKVAVYGEKKELCEEIDNLELKEECKMNIAPEGEREEFLYAPR